MAVLYSPKFFTHCFSMVLIVSVKRKTEMHSNIFTYLYLKIAKILLENYSVYHPYISAHKNNFQYLWRIRSVCYNEFGFHLRFLNEVCLKKKKKMIRKCIYRMPSYRPPKPPHLSQLENVLLQSSPQAISQIHKLSYLIEIMPSGNFI